MPDAIARIGGTVIQHGRHNDRIYVMKLAVRDMPSVVHRLYSMAKENSYSKIFAKVPSRVLGHFIEAGYTIEAYVPGFFNGREGGYFVAKYLDSIRSVDRPARAVGREPSTPRPTSSRRKASGITYHIAVPGDEGELAGIFQRVFSTYPFPIQDADYLLETMAKNIRYFFARINGRPVAVASSEMDHESGNVELTDFATLPEYRGNGISARLLRYMEQNMVAEGVKLAYTIARGTSYPINRVFSRAGYAYGGRLVNNTNICGGFESMNVWYKPLGMPPTSADR